MSRYHICYLKPPLWLFNPSDHFFPLLLLFWPYSGSPPACLTDASVSALLSPQWYFPSFCLWFSSHLSQYSLLAASEISWQNIPDLSLDWPYFLYITLSQTSLKPKSTLFPSPLSSQENLASCLHFPISVISFYYLGWQLQNYIISSQLSHIDNLSVKFNFSSFITSFVFFIFTAFFFIISLKSDIDLVNLLLNYIFQGHWLYSWKNGPSSLWSISVLFFNTLFPKLTAS